MILWQRQSPTIISLKSPSLLINNRFRRGSFLVGQVKKWNTSELCIFETVITYWTISAEAQLLNQGMLLLLSTQVIHMESSIYHTEYCVSRVTSKEICLRLKKEAKRWN